jgi:hypothetical protein
MTKSTASKFGGEADKWLDSRLALVFGAQAGLIVAGLRQKFNIAIDLNVDLLSTGMCPRRIPLL